MTLIIFTKCQDGYVLASDRKATSPSGATREEAKSRTSRRGWALAGAGTASAIQLVFYELEDERLLPASIENRVIDVLDRCNRVARVNAQCVLLTAIGGTILSRLIQPSEYGVFATPITAIFECYGEPGPVAVAKHFIRDRGGFENVPCTEAAPEILAILKRASSGGSFVGEQEDYGFGLIIFKNGSYWEELRITNEWGSLTTVYHKIDSNVPNFDFSSFEREQA